MRYICQHLTKIVPHRSIFIRLMRQLLLYLSISGINIQRILSLSVSQAIPSNQNIQTSKKVNLNNKNPIQSMKLNITAMICTLLSFAVSGKSKNASIAKQNGNEVEAARRRGIYYRDYDEYESEYENDGCGCKHCNCKCKGMTFIPFVCFVNCK